MLPQLSGRLGRVIGEAVEGVESSVPLDEGRRFCHHRRDRRAHGQPIRRHQVGAQGQHAGGLKGPGMAGESRQGPGTLIGQEGWPGDGPVGGGGDGHRVLGGHVQSDLADGRIIASMTVEQDDAGEAA